MRIGKLPVRISPPNQEPRKFQQLDCALINDKSKGLLCIAAYPVPAGAAMLVLEMNSDGELTPAYQAFGMDGRYLEILHREFPDLDWIR